MIGKKDVELSRIFEFMQTRNNIICVTIAPAMSECVIASALNGMDCKFYIPEYIK